MSDLLVNDAHYAIMSYKVGSAWAGVRASVCVQMYVHVCVVVHVMGSLAPLSASALITTAIAAHWGGEGGRPVEAWDCAVIEHSPKIGTLGHLAFCCVVVVGSPETMSTA